MAAVLACVQMLGLIKFLKKKSLISQNRILNDKSIYEISAITTTTSTQARHISVLCIVIKR